MIAVAQTTTPSLWQKLWEVPSLDSLARYLQEAGPVPMVITLALGLAVLLLGWRFFKVVVLINATMIGAFVGAELGARIPGEKAACRQQEKREHATPQGTATTRRQTATITQSPDRWSHRLDPP